MTMTRRCSSCGEMGHNSRTCCIITSPPHYGGGRLRLFGVDLPNSCCHCLDMKFAMDCLPNSSSSSSSLASFLSSSPPLYGNAENISNGYLSPYMTPCSQQSQHTRKGLQWTEEEHKIFLLGLETLGKGNWSGVSRYFVTTRTPTQVAVASHAQKYFQQQNKVGKIRKRRPTSLLDMGSGRLTAICAKISNTRDGYRLDYSGFNSSKPARALDLELTIAAPTPLE